MVLPIICTSMLIIFFIINRLAAHLFKQQDEAGFYGHVRLPKAYAIVGIIESSVCMLPFPLTYFLPDNFTNWTAVTAILFCLFQILGFALIIGYLNCRIDIYERKFVYHTLFGRKFEIAYADIVKIKESPHTTHLYTKDRHLYIDEFAVGTQEFFQNYYQDRRRVLHERKVLRDKNPKYTPTHSTDPE